MYIQTETEFDPESTTNLFQPQRPKISWRKKEEYLLPKQSIRDREGLIMYIGVGFDLFCCVAALFDKSRT